MGDTVLPPKSEKPVVQYLQELHDKLITVDKFASTHLQHEQTKWVSRYNLRSWHSLFTWRISDDFDSRYYVQSTMESMACTSENHS